MIRDKKIRKVILKIVEDIGRNYQPEKIILYGSYAYDNPKKDSDIDILIIKDTKERPIDRRIQVRRIVDVTKELIAFSPIVYTPKEIEYLLKIGDPFIKEIMAKGKVIYAK